VEPTPEPAKPETPAATPADATAATDPEPTSEPSKPDTPGEPAEATDATVTANKPILDHSVAMTAIHNGYRAQSGLPAQEVDTYLTSVAQQWAEHMASVGSMYHGGGEQIIAYSGGDTSYDQGFRLWLGSTPHRSWLCSRGDRCGFGYAIGRNGCAYYAGAFGSSETVSDASTSEIRTVSYSEGRSRRSRRR
jgi:uncharacterized protein YkwD